MAAVHVGDPCRRLRLSAGPLASACSIQGVNEQMEDLSLPT